MCIYIYIYKKNFLKIRKNCTQNETPNFIALNDLSLWGVAHILTSFFF